LPLKKAQPNNNDVLVYVESFADRFLTAGVIALGAAKVALQIYIIKSFTKENPDE
jgi:hypothetical protein